MGENWLIKYDFIYASVKNTELFKKFYIELSNTDLCLKNYTTYGNKIKEYLNITNTNVSIIDTLNIKNCLYVILCCIIRYIELKTNKTIYQIYGESRDLFEKKNKDYGDAFMDYLSIGVLVRLGDKIKRTENLIKKNNPNFESIDDTLSDSFNYVILALILL